MHLTLRYGNNFSDAIKHLQTSIDEKIVSGKGNSGWGTLRKVCDEYMVAHPSKKVTIDLRAGDDEIIALGHLSGTYSKTKKDQWSGDSGFKLTFDVEWSCVYPKSISIREMCIEQNIDPKLLLETPHHAVHCWRSKDLCFNIKKHSTITSSFLESLFSDVKETLLDIGTEIDTRLKGAMSEKDIKQSIKLLESLSAIMQSYPQQACLNKKLNLVTKKAGKSSNKGGSRKNKSQWENRTRKRIMAMDGKSNYAIAKTFTQKRYKTQRGKRVWSSGTIKSLKNKLFS